MDEKASEVILLDCPSRDSGVMPMRSHSADRPAGRINNGKDRAREGETC